MPTPDEYSKADTSSDAVASGATDLSARAEGTPDPLIGRKLGSYVIRSLLGSGGMGAVYFAVHPGIGSKVAIKLLHPQYATDKGVVERFFNEARSVNLIGHPNIIRIVDFDKTDDGLHYFVMEYLEGKSLGAFLHERGAMPIDEILPIVAQVCSALEAAHDHEIIHRDLKPDNVFLVAGTGQVKLVDFGIAKLGDRGEGDSFRTQSGTVMGTPSYMSPEQAAGDTALVDFRSDLYSLGVIVYQMLTGRVPFEGPSGKVVAAQIYEAPPPLRHFVPSATLALEQVVMRALSKEATQRQQGVAILLRELTAAAHGQPISVPVFEVEVPEAPPAEPPKEKDREPDLELDLPVEPIATPQAVAPIQLAPEPIQEDPPPVYRPAPAAPEPQDEQPIALNEPPERPRSRMGLWIGLTLAVAAGGFLAMRVPQNGQGALSNGGTQLVTLSNPGDADEDEPADQAPGKPAESHLGSKATARAAHANESARQLAADAKAHDNGGPTVRLFVVSVPLGAKVTCEAAKGQPPAPTPTHFDVPRGSLVHLTFSLRGHEDADRLLTATSPQAVSATLHALAAPK